MRIRLLGIQVFKHAREEKKFIMCIYYATTPQNDDENVELLRRFSAQIYESTFRKYTAIIL